MLSRGFDTLGSLDRTLLGHPFLIRYSVVKELEGSSRVAAREGPSSFSVVRLEGLEPPASRFVAECSSN